jgi:hypothetical protein
MYCKTTHAEQLTKIPQSIYTNLKTRGVRMWPDRLCGLVVSVADYKHRGPGHSFGYFWGSWVWNGVHSASWSDKLSSYLNKEVTARFVKLKMQLWDSMCWPHVNPVPSGAVGKDCRRRLLSRPRFVRACSATDLFIYYKPIKKPKFHIELKARKPKNSTFLSS